MLALRCWLIASLLCLLTCVVGCSPRDETVVVEPEPHPRLAPAAPAAASPTVALIATDGGDSALYLSKPGAPLPAPRLRLSHFDGGSVRAVTSPDGLVFAAAPARAVRDRSFDGGLFRLDPQSGDTRLLCEDVVHASRPMLDEDGRLYVVRGTAGAPPSPGQMRRDLFRVDRIDPQSGASSTVHVFEGHMVLLAGSHQSELFLYRVDASGADIVAVHSHSGAARSVVSSLPPFARDFSVDRANGRLVYRGRHESDPTSWVVDAVDLGTGQRQRLHQEGTFALAPHSWPGGGVALNAGRRGLTLLGVTPQSPDNIVLAPFGPGVDWVRGVSTDGRFVALLHTQEGRLPLPFVFDRQAQAALRLPFPAGTRVAIAGFLAEGAAP